MTSNYDKCIDFNATQVNRRILGSQCRRSGIDGWGNGDFSGTIANSEVLYL
jgi:hypothetical protein